MQTCVLFNAVYSILSYGILHTGESADAQTVLKSQKSTVRSVVHCHPKTPWRQLFKYLNILTFTSIFIFEVLKFYFGFVFEEN